MEISKDTIGKSYVLLRPDRRGEVRHLLVQKVTGTANTFLGYAKNLSSGGMFISTAAPKNIDEVLTVTFNLPDSSEKITCDARVAWVRDFDPVKRIDPGMGIEFKGIDRELRFVIEGWLEEETFRLKNSY